MVVSSRWRGFVNVDYNFRAADEAKIAANSTDVIQLLKTLQELLQNAIQKKRPTRLWESVYTISGPLTWKDFHLLAGRGLYPCKYLFLGLIV